MKKMWFEVCGCGALGGPHVYLHDDEIGKSPMPNMSVESATVLFDARANDRGDISAEERTEALTKLQSMGLEEKIDALEALMVLSLA